MMLHVANHRRVVAGALVSKGRYGLIAVALLTMLLSACGASSAPLPVASPPDVSPPFLPPLSEAPTRDDPAVALGRYAPDFELQSADGRTITLSQWRGQTVILNFWASWCDPCREEMPLLQATYEAYGDQGLVVLGVNMGEERLRVQGFAEDLGLTFPLLVDEETAVGSTYRVRGAPTTYFIDPEGVLRQRYVGPLTGQALASILSGESAYPNR